MEFSNVVIYRRSEMIGGINKIECKMLRIEEGQKWAQYNNAITVTFLEKGKRKLKAFILTYDPWMVVLPAFNAIEPDPWLVANPGAGSPGMAVSVSRYPSCDPRYKTDFVNKLEQLGIKPLFQIG